MLEWHPSADGLFFHGCANGFSHDFVTFEIHLKWLCIKTDIILEEQHIQQRQQWSTIVKRGK